MARTLYAAGFVAVMVFSACDVRVELNDGGAGGGTQNVGGGAGGGGGSQVLELWCSSSRPCPSGQFCFNGICALGCTSNANCRGDQYCDTEGDRLCHNNSVPTCSVSTDCFEQQVCIAGFCSTPPPQTQCNPDEAPSGNDGCDARSVCFDKGSSSMPEPKCYSLPACAADKTCPTGTQGAVCNDELIPNKEKICLIGLCRNASNCPADWACVRGVSTDVLGLCSSKTPGSPCAGPADCLSNSCYQPIAGFVGFCQ
ncbi:MAG: hypothetical protein ACO1OB_30000 [Archangium sp.]